LDAINAMNLIAVVAGWLFTPLQSWVLLEVVGGPDDGDKEYAPADAADGFLAQWGGHEYELKCGRWRHVGYCECKGR
jgi:hypothetical protein